MTIIFINSCFKRSERKLTEGLHNGFQNLKKNLTIVLHRYLNFN